MGAQSFFNAGTTASGLHNHGLLKFNVSDTLPPGSRITRASLTLEVVFEPQSSVMQSTYFRLHRLLQPWGEGNKTSNGATPGLGAMATLNEATWNHRFSGTNLAWSAPGGEEGNDFVTSHSASQFIYGILNSPYVFDSATDPQLKADVQLWLDAPQSNFGWLLKPDDDLLTGTARRFGSREDPSNAPLLDIEFVPPPAIENTRLTGSELEFSFYAEAAQPYILQFKNTLEESWSTLTNIPPASQGASVVVRDGLSTSRRFYRVLAP